MSNDSSDGNERPYCYIDHANNQREMHSRNPYLAWLNQNRRQRARDDARREPALPEDDRKTA